MNLLFCTIVWGEKYLDIFLNFVIPVMISTADYPIIPGNRNYIIFTDEYGKEKIKESAIFKYLQNYFHVTFAVIDIPADPQKFIIDTFAAMVGEAYRQKAYLKFQAPDTIPCHGSYGSAYRILSKGYKGLIFPVGAYRTNYSILDAIRGKLLNIDEMIQESFKHLHYETACHIVTAHNFHPYPAQIIFHDGDNLNIHSFINQPWLVKPDFEKIDFHEVEYDFAFNCVDDVNQLYISKYEDGIFELSLTKEYDAMHLWPENKFDTDKVSNFIRGKLYHKAMLKTFAQGFKFKKDLIGFNEVNQILERIGV